MKETVLITGATGMIGSLILQHCLNSDKVNTVVSLVRRPSGFTHEKLNEVVVEDFLTLDENASYLKKIDVVYYCLGVYTGAVNRETFRQITVDYPETLARILISNNADLRFCLLSGAGADRTEKSSMMFAKDKGVIENRLSKMGFKGFHSFRPGYIYPVTPRNEPGLGYRILRWMYPIIKLFGSNSSIRSTQLAKAMFKIGLQGDAPEILENNSILAKI